MHLFGGIGRLGEALKIFICAEIFIILVFHYVCLPKGVSFFFYNSNRDREKAFPFFLSNYEYYLFLSEPDNLTSEDKTSIILEHKLRES